MFGRSDGLIIGAGPYGLSLAAHLNATRTRFRIVGSPMAPWQTSMPAGMFLKSEGFASTLYEPSGRFTLGAYCREQGLPYADTGEPVPVDTFIAYGQAFQQRLVPAVEDRTVVALRRTADGFEATCADGGTIGAGWVVMAAGILDFANRPAELDGLGRDFATHSSDHHDLSRFAGQDVIVLGAGASAMDVAAALRIGGARVTVVTRRKQVAFQTPLGERSVVDRIRAPMTVVGPGWKSVLCTEAPIVFHFMPDRFRTDVVRRYLGPAPGWFTRQHVENHVPMVTSSTILGTEVSEGRVHLTLGKAGEKTRLSADHVIAATGFKVDVGRIGFLDSGLAAAVQTVEGAPRLSRHFESSVPGLYFVGPAAANSFGPLLRFAAGAGFTARRLSRHIAGQAARRPADRRVSASADTVAVDG